MTLGCCGSSLEAEAEEAAGNTEMKAFLHVSPVRLRAALTVQEGLDEVDVVFLDQLLFVPRAVSKG